MTTQSAMAWISLFILLEGFLVQFSLESNSDYRNVNLHDCIVVAQPSEQDKQRRKQPDHADKELFLPSAKSPAQLFWTGPQLYSHVDSHFYNHYLILG